jgi:DNA-directed RNA polymerase beta subunit
MTNEGTFLVYGIQRPIINQIVRSSGIGDNTTFDKKGMYNYNYTKSLISTRVTKIKFEMDTDDLINVKITEAKKVFHTCF